TFIVEHSGSVDVDGVHVHGAKHQNVYLQTPSMLRGKDFVSSSGGLAGLFAEAGASVTLAHSVFTDNALWGFAILGPGTSPSDLRQVRFAGTKTTTDTYANGAGLIDFGAPLTIEEAEFDGNTSAGAIIGGTTTATLSDILSRGT